MTASVSEPWRDADPGLADWVDDVVAALEADDGAVVPDFVEAVARARAIDPEIVSARMLDDARALAPVIPLATSVEPDPGPDAGLVAFLDDVRAEGSAAAEARKLAAIPAPPAPIVSRRPRRAAWAGAAVAAVLVLGIGVAAAMSALRGSSSEPATQAQHAVAPMHAPIRVEPAPVAPAPVEVVEPAPELPEEVGPAPELAPADEVEDTGPPRDRSRSAVSGASTEDRLRELDAQAQRRWKAGELDEASRLFREIIRIGRRGRYVELAYGDLFALARQESAGERIALWEEYLREFPSGRHADDARGGLCRLSAAGERAQCWEQYLERTPGGSYRHEAMRAVESDR